MYKIYLVGNDWLDDKGQFLFTANSEKERDKLIQKKAQELLRRDNVYYIRYLQVSKNIIIVDYGSWSQFLRIEYVDDWIENGHKKLLERLRNEVLSR